MKTYLTANYTRYSTEDLTRIADSFQDHALSCPPAELNPEWGKDWKWSFGHDDLPFSKLVYWQGWLQQEVDHARGMSTGLWGGHRGKPVAGPWFTWKSGAGHRSRSDDSIIKVLSPDAALSALGPMEQLASSASTTALPELTAQLVYLLLKRSGLRLLCRQASESDMLQAVRIFIERTDTKVRVMKHRQTKVVPLTEEERVRSLLQTFKNGGAANGMNWKRWAVREKSEEHFDNWLKSETQRKRLEKAGLEIESHPSTADMLRAVAREYEQREKAAKDG